MQQRSGRKALSPSSVRPRSVLPSASAAFILLIGLHATPSHSQSAPSGTVAVKPKPLEWKTIEPGYAIARVELGSGAYLISSELLLARIDPSRFDFELVRAKDFKHSVLNVREMTIAANGFIGINTHFFDPAGNPLGLLVRNGQTEHRLQQGGSVLSGVLTLSQGRAAIVHRSGYHADKEPPRLALQAGPRLIDNGKPVQLKAPAAATRRSGVAVTRSGDLLLFATFLRFPGATLEQIQEFLLRPELQVVDALNLDGGGSSQFFIAANEALEGEMFISGGDPVPVGLIVRRKKE